MASEKPELPALMPPFYANRFWTFISDAAEPLRLKLVMENARNYAIAVSVRVAGLLIDRSGTGPSFVLGGWFLIVVGAALTFGTVCQSWSLFLRGFHTYVGVLSGSAILGTVKIFGLIWSVGLIAMAGWRLVDLLVGKGLK
jgi:hypothetical protein